MLHKGYEAEVRYYDEDKWFIRTQLAGEGIFCLTNDGVWVGMTSMKEEDGWWPSKESAEAFLARGDVTVPHTPEYDEYDQEE